MVALASGQLYAQSPAVVIEKWADKPSIHSLDNKYSKESAVIISDVRRVEYVDGAKDEMAQYYTLHKIIHINDDAAIENFNKIYLGFNEKADVVDVKARTILPNGKVFELNKDNIKDIKEKDGSIYKIFAMDGLEKGCEVEYTYTFKRPLSYMGREVVQTAIPVEAATFQVICPDRLRFDLKSFNFDQTATDTVINNKRIAEFKLKSLPAVDEEKYSAYAANLDRIEYKLSYNDAARKGIRLFTWNDLAKRVYGAYTDYNEKENNAVQALIKENGWEGLPDEQSKIIAVENYVKKKFGYNEDLNDEAQNQLGAVLKNKIGGTTGTLQLYSAIFKDLGIGYQYVLACDRTRLTIDRSFENWNNLDYTLLYFPAENKYIAPTRPDFRYPWIVPAWGESYGIFCKPTTLGNVTTAIADVKNIGLEDYSKSVNNTESKLELNPGLDSLTIDAKQIYSGYPAVEFRDVMNYANDEDKRKIMKEMAKMISSSDNIISSEVLNPEFEKANTNVPLTVHIKTKSGELIERAGNKLLVKIGLVIGPQVEMYQEKPRQTPVSIDYGHIEERKIDFLIPAGYTISNPNDLKINQTYKQDGDLTMGFVSDYKLAGNVLSVHIMEEYRKTYYPLTQFSDFRKIINASSDFNKVVLVLEKK